jgi:hypothetical protein
MLRDPSGLGADREAVHIAVLEQAYESIRAIYHTICQWTIVFGAAWGGLLTFGIHNRSGLAVLTAGVLVLILAYEINVAGKAVGALLLGALAAEKQLGLPASEALGAAFFVGFRGTKSLAKLKLIMEDADSGSDTSVALTADECSLFHPSRSRTALVILIAGAVQVLGAVSLVWAGYLTLL